VRAREQRPLHVRWLPAGLRIQRIPQACDHSAVRAQGSTMENPVTRARATNRRARRLMGDCAHERFITLMFGERECLDCGHIELPD
jgi:hypothetical protein